VTLAGMSFSFSAGGTKTQTLDSLAKITREQSRHTPQALVDLLIDMVGSGPEVGAADGREIVYSVSAYGHQAAGSLPTLSVSLGCSYRPRPEDRGGIESAPDPADVR
jgi:hypothetical protein